MDPLDSKQTGDSLAAEHQTNNEIRRIIEHSVLQKSHPKEEANPKRKIYMGLGMDVSGHDICFQIEMFEKLRYLTSLSELPFFYIQH